MQKENIWKLLARKMAGEATEEELKELQRILESDRVMKYTAEAFSRLWNTLSNQQLPENNLVKGECKEG